MALQSFAKKVAHAGLKGLSNTISIGYTVRVNQIMNKFSTDFWRAFIPATLKKILPPLLTR